MHVPVARITRDAASLPFKGVTSDARCQLIEAMQQINFGRIEQLELRGGDPVFCATARSVTTHKLKGTLGARAEVSKADFALKLEVVELFQIFDRVQDGIIDLIDVKHGLPFLVEVSGLLV